jgi:uncharacterized protein (TIGR02453 family)
MIRKLTLDFLADLKQNNNREWFQLNKDRYDEARFNVLQFTESVIRKLAKIDPAIDERTPAKNCVMRIYRDIRFRKDKTPYKINFGIDISSNIEGLGYYIHIQPGASFAGGGYWMPGAQHLKAIRQEIDYNADALKAIIDAPEFVELFGDFRLQEQLKTSPRDYDASNTNLDLIRLKSFASVHSIKDTDLLKQDAEDKIVNYLRMIHPLNVFLANAIS